MSKRILNFLLPLLIGALLTTLYMIFESYILQSIHISVVSKQPSYILRMLLLIPTVASVVLTYFLLLQRSKIKKDEPDIAQRIINARKTIKLFTVDNLKWKTTIDEKGNFQIDPTPFCKDHELSFISYGPYGVCPEYIKHNCKSKINPDDLSPALDNAQSCIEREIRTSASSNKPVVKQTKIKPWQYG